VIVKAICRAIDCPILALILPFCNRASGKPDPKAWSG
jgi:hypothetical protein